MEQLNKKTMTHVSRPRANPAQRIVFTLFGVIEAMLLFRLLFKLLGANPDNGFVHGIYVVSQFFVGIFENIFPRLAVTGIENAAVFEPATLIAMVVIGLIAWGTLTLMAPKLGTYLESTEYSEHENPGK